VTSLNGPKHTSGRVTLISALPPKADIKVTHRHVRFGPQPDISTLASVSSTGPEAIGPRGFDDILRIAVAAYYGLR
jgi:hypothetical protein